MIRLSLQQRRFALQLGFFALFVLAPVLNLLRFDLTRGHAYLLGFEWTLGLSGFIAGEVGAGTVALNLLLRGLLPRNPWYWLPTLAAVLGFAFLWAVVLLTYLLPPALVYGGLLSGTLARGPTLFILIATLAFTIEFMFARHLFCRFGCAVGLFQSLAWMANDRAMVVGFDGARADACHDCNNACDNVCPMRLRPRTLKRRMFTCTECAQCISACGQVQAGGLGDARLAAQPQPSLLRWVEGGDALPAVTGRPAVQVGPAQAEPAEQRRLALNGRAPDGQRPISPAAGASTGFDGQASPFGSAGAVSPPALGARSAFRLDPATRTLKHQPSRLAPASAAVAPASTLAAAGACGRSGER